MTTRACVLSWDNSTRGLDASTALDYAKSLRIIADVFKTTMFVSLYQAGEGIFEQFDKVLLIDQGRQVYFGPAKEARPYMLSLGYRDLPRQTSADYLTGCTDENERQFADSIDVDKVPKTPEELEKAYNESEICKRMLKEREEYEAFEKKEVKIQEEFRAAVGDDKRRGVGKKSPYTVSFFEQVRALVIRQARIRMQDRLGFSFAYITSITTAIIACVLLSLSLFVLAATDARASVTQRNLLPQPPSHRSRRLHPRRSPLHRPPLQLLHRLQRAADSDVG